MITLGILATKFAPSQYYQNNLEVGGQFIILNELLSGIKSWQSSTQIMSIVSQAQELMTQQFPFFLITKPPPQPTPQPASTQLVKNISSLLSTTFSGEKKSDQPGVLDSVLAQIPFTQQRKNAELKKDQETLQINVDNERDRIAQNLRDAIFESRQYLDKQVYVYAEQQRAEAQVQQMESNMFRDMERIHYTGQECDAFITANEELRLNLDSGLQMLQMDPLSTQVVQLMGDIIAMRETQHFMVHRFKRGEGDLESVTRATRRIAEQMFDNQVLLRKCMQ